MVVAVVVVAVVVVAVTLATTGRAGGHTVSTPFLSFTAPPGWTADAPGPTAARDSPALVGAVHGPGYECGGEPSVRGFAAAALLPVGATGPADRAERLARWFAATAYAAGGVAPEVTVAPPRPVRVAGADGPVEGTVTEVTVGEAPVGEAPVGEIPLSGVMATGAAGGGGCPPATGTVLVLGAPVSGGAALLLVAGDTGGGPAEPAPPDRATLDAVLASVRLGPG